MTQAEKPVVFIHTNEKQYLGGLVARHSILRTTKNPDDFDIRFIRLEDYPALTSRSGQKYLRNGKQVLWEKDDLQSFTLLRFLPPELMGYRGRALVIDPDVFAITDIRELLFRDLGDKPLACRWVDPGEGKKGYYATSVMLMQCDQLTDWKWEQLIDDLFSSRQDYKTWMNLENETPERVVHLEDGWNHFDTLDADTKLLHNTGRVTQPWKTGLPIDFVNEKKGGVVQKETYREHPDKKQERLFFQLLRGCLESGDVTVDFLHEEMRKAHVRPDALQILEQV